MGISGKSPCSMCCGPTSRKRQKESTWPWPQTPITTKPTYKGYKHSTSRQSISSKTNKTRKETKKRRKRNIKKRKNNNKEKNIMNGNGNNRKEKNMNSNQEILNGMIEERKRKSSRSNARWTREEEET